MKQHKKKQKNILSMINKKTSTSIVQCVSPFSGGRRDQAGVSAGQLLDFISSTPQMSMRSSMRCPSHQTNCKHSQEKLRRSVNNQLLVFFFQSEPFFKSQNVGGTCSQLMGQVCFLGQAVEALTAASQEERKMLSEHIQPPICSNRLGQDLLLDEADDLVPTRLR